MKFSHVFGFLIKCLSSILIVILLSACVGRIVPDYHLNEIKRHLHDQPKAVWQYPDFAKVNNLNITASLTRFVRPEPVPKYMQGIEPPFITGIDILKDGSLVLLSPLEYEYASRWMGVGQRVWREIPSKVRMIVLNGENGTKIWERDITAAGLYGVLEINDVLILQARKYDIHAKPVKTELIALDRNKGSLLWQTDFEKPLRYVRTIEPHDMVLLSVQLEEDSPQKTTTSLTDIHTGKAVWSTEAGGPSSQASAWPIILEDAILVFENGITYRRITDGRILWKHEDINISGTAQPLAKDDRLFAMTKNGLAALDIASGRILWTIQEIEGDIIKMSLFGKHLALAKAKGGLFGDKHVVIIVDHEKGSILWKHEAKPLLSPIVISEKAVYFSTASQLVSLDVNKGKEVFSYQLPWDDKYSLHTIVLLEDAIAVKNEWNIVSLNLQSGKMAYHHTFEPLCPLVTTEERMLEQEKLTGSSSSMSVASMHYDKTAIAKQLSMAETARRNYSRTGNSRYLHQAQFHSYTASALQSIEAAKASVQLGASIMSLGLSMKKLAIMQAHSMVYPQIDQVIHRLSSFDTNEFVVRLVGVQEGKQRLSALEIVHIPSGKVSRQLLSPYQSTTDLMTIGRSFMSATVHNGYIRVAVYLPHNFSTTIDLDRKRIFHYGPGLNTNEYTFYDKGGFVRGRLMMYPLNLPPTN
ncbi:MAG: PQQ-binding-like beta-propeller repeat protein [bacterium]